MNQRGSTLNELLVVLWILAVALAVVGLGGDRALRRASTEAVARQVRGLLWRARAEAFVLGTASGLVFDETAAGRWRCRAVIDGDGDGIRRSDIDAGVDRVFSEIERLGDASGYLGILDQRVPDPSGRGWLGGDLADPVRAGRGDIITFTASGTATPSTVYFCDGEEEMRALRVYGATGRVRSLAWRVGWPEWKQGRL
ncbi:MAG: hypothetical protein JKP92_09065 [Alphaproteobacteria bacterium]|jgi:type II secretory pathway pseudopilin PulG|nr:hypothetical protein [Alphaproteobacteria bacterium]